MLGFLRAYRAYLAWLLKPMDKNHLTIFLYFYRNFVRKMWNWP